MEVKGYVGNKEIQGNISCKDGHNKRQMIWTQQKQKILRGGKNTQKNYKKKIFMTQRTTMV